jgi:hypothetical protein
MSPKGLNFKNFHGLLRFPCVVGSPDRDTEKSGIMFFSRKTLFVNGSKHFPILDYTGRAIMKIARKGEDDRIVHFWELRFNEWIRFPCGSIF